MSVNHQNGKAGLARRRTGAVWGLAIAGALGLATALGGLSASSLPTSLAAEGKTFTPQADAHVEEASSSRNYGGASRLLVDGSPRKQTYLRFEVSGLSGDVQSATLRLYAVDDTGDGPTVHATSNDWSENKITWSNRPGPDGSALDDLGTIARNRWIEYDVTELVDGNGTYSFVLLPESGNGVDFTARNASNPPQLVVTTDAASSATPTKTATATPTGPTPTRTPTPTGPSPTATATPTGPTPTATTTPTGPSATATPTATPTGPSACRHTIPLSVETADGAGNYDDVKPGDTVCIAAGNRDGLELRNFHGTASAPITFVNSGGVVNLSDTLEIAYSDHIRVTGTGVSAQCGAGYAANAQQCGIRVTSNSKGVLGRPRAEHLELDHIEVYNAGDSGFVLWDNTTSRGSWSQHDVEVHHSYIHDVYDEGFYVGSSYWQNGDDHELDGVRIHHNLVARTGRDGVQVGSAVANCEIHSNVIRETGLQGGSSHHAGVMVNQGSVCDVERNWIEQAGGAGIYDQGQGGNRIHTNVIVRPGVKLADKGNGITIGNGASDDDPLAIWQNTVVEAARNGVQFSRDGGSGHQVQNNLVAASSSSAISADSNVTVSHNVTSDTLSGAGFTDPAAGNYRLRSDSRAVDAGRDLRPQGVTTDYAGTSRPKGAAFDVGAYERTQ